MSYTVLARKWRPKNFTELVGQSHVMQALSNALDQQRLHHAYLFTGTRGVGKTTIARIFAKALNCQEGVSSSPCGVCETCRSIDEGRFIDLIEVDAASKTKVDDTREILDNVQFAPTQGRYKVYLIDEVHMLSKSSFNALLKTLEEPPEHVKFLLATTDPHKLPITVLSRCLQFNLMRLTQPQIQGHLAHILGQENIPFEDSALALIAKSADGSARDSLSLLDQAIAYGAGEVMFEPVQTMLGLVDQQFGVAILQALATNDPQQIKSVIQQLATMGVDYQALLAQLIESLHAISYVQVFADNETTTLLPAEIVKSFADNIEPERVQLLYQIALLTKQDMQLAPDIRIGFEMALMRMLAFQPAKSQVNEASAVTNVVTNQETQAQNPITSLSDDSGLSPMDALASLATARSLVGKKNTSISPESPCLPEDALNKVQQGSNQTLDNAASLASPNIPNESADFIPNKIEEPFIRDSYADSPNQATAQQYSPEEYKVLNHDSVAPVQNEADSNIVNSQPKPVAATDHLAQIRERLKQPFAKPTQPVNPEVGSKDIASTQTNATNPTIIENSPSHDIDNLNNLDKLDKQEAPVSIQTKPESIDQIYGSDSIDSSLSQPSERLQNQANKYDIEPHSQQEHHSLENNDSLLSAVDEDEDVSQISAVEHSDSLAFTSPNDNVKNQGDSDSNFIENSDDSFTPSNDSLQDWLNIINRLELKGMANDMARNSVLVELTENRLQMSIDPEQQYAKPEMILEQIEIAVKAYFGQNFILEIVQANEHFTPVKQEQQLASDKQQAAQQSIDADGVVNAFISNLGMEVIPGTLKPV